MPSRRRTRRPSGHRLLSSSHFASKVAGIHKTRFLRHLRRRKPSSASNQYQRNSGRLVSENSKILEWKEKRKAKPLSDDDDDDDENDEGIVNVDFVFNDLETDDFHGVKNFLHSYIALKEWDLSNFVELIVEQPLVGSVVKVEDDDDGNLFGVITALNIGTYKGHKCISEIKKFILQKCDETDLQRKIRTSFEDNANNVGLLVCRRVTNLPLELLPPLYDTLFKEVSVASEIKELGNQFDFKFYLILTRLYMKTTVSQRRGSSNSDGMSDPIIYVNFEDEIFHKLSSWSFTFPTQELVPSEFGNYRSAGLVMVVETSKISRFCNELKSLVDES